MKWAPLLALSAAAALAAGTETKVKLPASRADLLRGEKMFQVHCALCHGAKGEGGRGPALARAKLPRAPDDAALVKVIESGIRGTEMPGAGAMSDREMRQTAAYVRSLGKVAQKPVPGDPARGADDLSWQRQLRGLPLDPRRRRRRWAGSLNHRRVAQRRLPSRIRRRSAAPPSPRGTCW